MIQTCNAAQDAEDAAILEWLQCDTRLIDAAATGRLPHVEALLDAGIDVNMKSDQVSNSHRSVDLQGFTVWHHFHFKQHGCAETA